ncbi:hypothetical protein ABH941_006449 [Streptacidiphilus sp. EB103A]
MGLICTCEAVRRGDVDAPGVEDRQDVVDRVPEHRHTTAAVLLAPANEPHTEGTALPPAHRDHRHAPTWQPQPTGSRPVRQKGVVSDLQSSVLGRDEAALISGVSLSVTFAPFTIHMHRPDRLMSAQADCCTSVSAPGLPAHPWSNSMSVPAPVFPQADPGGRASASSPGLLVVEDAVGLAAMPSAALQLAGFDSVTAAAGRPALEAVTLQPPRCGAAGRHAARPKLIRTVHRLGYLPPASPASRPRTG